MGILACTAQFGCFHTNCLPDVGLGCFDLVSGLPKCSVDPLGLAGEPHVIEQYQKSPQILEGRSLPIGPPILIVSFRKGFAKNPWSCEGRLIVHLFLT